MSCEELRDDLASPSGGEMVVTTDGATVQDAISIAATPAALIAGTKSPPVGSTVRTADGYVFRVAAAGASDADVANAAGTKFYAEPLAGAFWVEQFGAIGDGVTDDTAAFAQAASVRGRVIRLGAGKNYSVSNFTIADGVKFLGDAPHGYTAYDGADAFNYPRMRMRSGATCLMNVANTRGVTIEGVLLDGVNRSAPVVSAGSNRLTLRRCRIINGSVGVGGSVGGGSAYHRVLHMDQCVVASNNIGLQNPIDGFIFHCELAANGTNLYLQAGADSSFYIGIRIEWATAALGTGVNIRIAGTSGNEIKDNSFVGCQVDRGSVAGVRIAYGHRITFTGGFIRRSNASGSSAADENCLVHMVGCDGISFTGISYSRGPNDDGGGFTTPDYVFNFSDIGTVCNRVAISSGACGDGFTGFVRGSQHCTNLRVSNVPGVADFSNDTASPQASNGGIHRARAIGTANASGGTVNLSLRTGLALGTYTTEPLEIIFSARNESTGIDYVAKIILAIQTEEGSASAAGLTVIGQSTAGFVGVGTGTLQLSAANVAVDGSSFDLVIANGATANVKCTARLNI